MKSLPLPPLSLYHINFLTNYRPSEQQNDIENSTQQQDESLNDDSASNICNVDEYNRIFRPKNEIKRVVVVNKSISNPVVSNNIPTKHANIKREVSPPSQSTPIISSRPNVLQQQQQQPQKQDKINYSPTIKQQPKSPFSEKNEPNFVVQSSLPSKEVLNQKLSNDKNKDNGVNMNDFIPVCYLLDVK